MTAPVVDAQQTTSLTRTLRVNDELSFDNRRIVLRVMESKGRRVQVNIQMEPEVAVDKPPKPTK